MNIDFLFETFRKNKDLTALVWNGEKITYQFFIDQTELWSEKFKEEGISAGKVVSLEGDFSPNCISLFLALIAKDCIIVPQSNTNRAGREIKDKLAQVENYIYCDENDHVTWQRADLVSNHQYYSKLKQIKKPGLVLFSSGTSGDPKAAVHDFSLLLEKFKVARRPFTTLNFLLFDHWGGLNTMLHTLSNAGTIVTAKNRSPDEIGKLIQEIEIQLLPATPTFLNLMLLSGIPKKYNLSSLEVITYGAEPMLQTTLKRLKAAFPNIKLQQTYGLIEVGVLRTKSKGDDSLWLKVGGEGYQTRVVEGILHIKTKSTILGYLNADTPMSKDGWFITGDAVEEDGEYLKILGRKSEMINVGGEKVFPTEIENIILTMNNVSDVVVYGEKNPIIGSLICAKVCLLEDEDQKDFSNRLKQLCLQKLDRFKVPVKVIITDKALFGVRFKKSRTL